MEDNRKIFQLIDGDGRNVGLYSVPVGTSETDFMIEFRKFDEQYDFDEENTIGAIREYVDEIYIDNPF